MQKTWPSGRSENLSSPANIHQKCVTYQFLQYTCIKKQGINLGNAFIKKKTVQSDLEMQAMHFELEHLEEDFSAETGVYSASGIAELIKSRSSFSPRPKRGDFLRKGHDFHRGPKECLMKISQNNDHI